jgi:hypothetical protein
MMIDPEREHGRAGERTAREQVEEPERARRVVLLQLRDLVEVDVRDGHVRTDAEDEDDEDREEDLLPEVGDPEHVAQAREPGHGADDLLSTRGCECS